ncbi:hypothetical protein [Vibrio sp. 1S139]|uniref:hypothetical protein n=1 Tax=Vibrio sp. 1S139 TaxID=3230006 RepID=UPI00352F263F
MKNLETTMGPLKVIFDTERSIYIHIGMYLSLYMLAMTVSSTLLLALSLFFLLASTVPVFIYNPKYYLYVVAITSLSLLFNSLFNVYPLNRLVFNHVFLMGNFILGVLILKNKICPLKISKYALVVFFTYLSVMIALSYLLGERVITLISRLQIGFSYNYISGYIIVLGCIYLSLKVFFSKVSSKELVLSLLIFIFCFVLYGRSGILFSFLIMVILLINFMNEKYSLKYMLFLTGPCVVLLFLFKDNIVDVISMTKFGASGIESPRSILINDYLEGLTYKSLLYGVDMRAIPSISHYNVNPHNSILNFHSSFGIFSFVWMFFIVSLFVYLLAINITAGLLLSIIILRGLLDTMIFPGPFDFLLIGVLLKFCDTSKFYLKTFRKVLNYEV